MNDRDYSGWSKSLALVATLLVLAGCVPPQSPPQSPSSGSSSPAPAGSTPSSNTTQPLPSSNTTQPGFELQLEPPSNTTQPLDTDGAAASIQSGEISAQVADIKMYRDLLAQHRGKVVMVDFWATWCPPCREQFPHTTELSRKYADRGLAVMSVSLDEPENKAKVEEFLKANVATFDNLISQYGVGVASAELFEIGNDGALPFYKLYDRQGTLRYQFGAQVEEGVELVDQIDARVEQLLAENG